MGKNRLFIPQETMDQWVDVSHAVVQDNELCLANDGRVYQLAPAMLFLREATGADDPHDLVGRVKEESVLTILGADAYMDSVILEDNAYDVCRGFVAVPAIAPARKATLPPPSGVEVKATETEPAVLSSPPDIIDVSPKVNVQPVDEDRDVQSNDTADSEDEADDELENLSHELEDDSEERETLPEAGIEDTAVASKSPAPTMNEDDEEDDVLAKLLLKSLK